MLVLWIVLAAATGVVVALGLVVAVGRESHERRGGMLELDTREALDGLAAIVAAEARFVEVFGRSRRIVRRWNDGSVTTLLACGHTAINDSPVVSFHGREFCSFECVNASIARAPGGDAA